MKVIQILNKLLRLDGEPIGEFAKALAGLTKADKLELALNGATILGVEVLDAADYAEPEAAVTAN